MNGDRIKSSSVKICPPFWKAAKFFTAAIRCGGHWNRFSGLFCHTVLHYNFFSPLLIVSEPSLQRCRKRYLFRARHDMDDQHIQQVAPPPYLPDEFRGSFLLLHLFFSYLAECLRLHCY